MKKAGCLSYVVVIIISCVLALTLAGVIDRSVPSFLDTPSDTDFCDSIVPDDTDAADTDFDETDTPDTDKTLDDDGVVDPELDTASSFTAYYDQLLPEEKAIYDAVWDAVDNGEKSLVFKNIDCEAYETYLTRAIYGFTYDHPEYFWMCCGYMWTTLRLPFETMGDIELELMHYDYWDYKSTKQKAKEQKELEQAVQKVAVQANRYDSDFEKVLFVHDYLVENAYYDHDGLDEYYQSYHDADCEYIFSAYGCLVNGKTVCAGYAKAFQMIMSELGFDCMYVTGDAGGGHAWNCIYIEDESYYIDITWDDHDFDHDEAVYEYFCITEEALNKTHELDPNFEFPDCTAEKYNYFKYLDYHLESYSFDEVCRVVEEQEDQNVINVQFSSLTELQRAYDELITNGKVNKIPSFARGKFSFLYNENHYTMTFVRK